MTDEESIFVKIIGGVHNISQIHKKKTMGNRAMQKNHKNKTSQRNWLEGWKHEGAQGFC